MHDHQRDSDSSEDSMDNPPLSLTPEGSAAPSAPSAPPLPAAQQLDRNTGVATRIKDKRKKMSRGRCMLLAVCLVIIFILVTAIKAQQDAIKAQQDAIKAQQDAIKAAIKAQQDAIKAQQDAIKAQKDKEDKESNKTNFMTMLGLGCFIIKVGLYLSPPGTFVGNVLSTVSPFVDMLK